MKRILVTGANGFIGSNCLGLLVRHGFEVHAVSSRPQIESEGVTWHCVDLLDRSRSGPLIESVRPTHLLHLAWMAVPGRVYTSPENLGWVQASLDLVQAFAQHGGRRIVVAGSCYEYAQQHGLLNEQWTPTRPHTLYGVCKHALQELLAAYCRSGELSLAWPRIFFLYGPHERPQRLASSVICSLLRGEAARCSHGRQLRDFMCVEDLADGLVTLLESEVTGPINFGSGTPVTVRTIVDCIADQIGRPDLIELGALPARPDETPLVVADATRMIAELGWSPRLSLEEGIERTIAWWKKELDRASCPEHTFS